MVAVVARRAPTRIGVGDQHSEEGQVGPHRLALAVDAVQHARQRAEFVIAGYQAELSALWASAAGRR